MNNNEYNEWKCKIGGSFRGLIPALIVLFVFGGTALWLHLTNNGAFILVAPLALIAVLLNVVVIYRALFIKLLIGDFRFYYQSSPTKGRTFKYGELSEAWLNGTLSGGYLFFKTHDGRVTKIALLGGDDFDSADFFIKRFNTVKEIDRTAL